MSLAVYREYLREARSVSALLLGLLAISGLDQK